MLRHACSVLCLDVTLGTSALGQLIHSAESSYEVVTRASRFKPWAESGGLREKFLAAKEICLPILVTPGKLIRDCVVLFVRGGVSGVRLGEAESLVFRVYDRVQRVGLANSLASRIEMLLPRPASVRGGREVRVEMQGALPDGAHAGEIGCLALGLAVKCVADAAKVGCSSPGDVGFAYALRHRVSACVQDLRDEAYRRGVRDAVRAAVRDAGEGEGRSRKANAFFRRLLERLATSSTEGAALRATSDLSARALKEVTKVVGMQATHVVTWNIAGDDVAKDAMKGFSKADKSAWLRSVFERWSEVDILAVQESPTSAALEALSGMYRLLGSCKSHAGERCVQLYVRERVEAEVAEVVQGAPAVAAWVTLDTSTLLVLSVHLAPGREGARTRLAQMKKIKKYVDAQLARRTSGAAAVGVLLLGDLNVRSEEVRR